MLTKEQETAAQLQQGYAIRPATTEDLPAVLEVIHACSRKYLGTEEGTLEDIQNEWATPGFNLETDTRVALDPEGNLVGACELWTVSDVPVNPWNWWRVHPEHTGKGIEAAFLAWGEERAHKAFEKVPAGARVAMRSNTITGNQSAKDAMAAHGMQLIRHGFEMRIEMEQMPPAPEWSKGIRLVTFDGSDEQLEAIYRADDEAFADHFGHVQEPFESGFERFKHFMVNDKLFDKHLWFLAMDGDEIAGLSLCRRQSWADKEAGYVDSLAVRKPWRKRGIGLALLQHSFRAFWERSKRKVDLGVDAENLTGALRLYKKAGMRVLRQYDLYEKELRPGKDLSRTTLEE
jgi:ribosomal protein S18 acetylase RimI-like enzyme